MAGITYGDEVSMLASEVVLPAQFFVDTTLSSPTHRLMLAVLTDAIYQSQRQRGKGWNAACNEARAWLRSNKRSLFSFVNVCEELNLNVDIVRAKLALGPVVVPCRPDIASRAVRRRRRAA